MMRGFISSKRPAGEVVDVVAGAVKGRELNLGLFLDKYVLWCYDDEEGRWEHGLDVQVSLLRKVCRDPQEVKGLLGDFSIPNGEFRRRLAEDGRLCVPVDAVPLSVYESYMSRMTRMLSTLGEMGFHVEYLPDERSGLPLSWRLAVNLGAASIYEASLLLHRNYSVPYIPGSAVKGATRHLSIRKFARAIQELEGTPYGDAARRVDAALEKGEDLGVEVDGVKFKTLIDVFGARSQKGKVIFFDALPVLSGENECFIVLDVVNVHYKEYYQDRSGRTPPGDWVKPSPVFFLAVEGVKFRFALASRDRNLAGEAKRLLREALESCGIGARTSAGYGYFEV
ncbi:MAG: type III-B CRISPR module RAMP protein Cmr6 [Candidatus Freyarchaeota archaeon]